MALDLIGKAKGSKGLAILVPPWQPHPGAGDGRSGVVCQLVMPVTQALRSSAPCLSTSAELNLSLRRLKPRFQSHNRTCDYVCVDAKTVERVPHPFDIRMLNLK
jgi:hypothetical protein